MNRLFCALFNVCIVTLLSTAAGCANRSIVLVDEFFEEYYLSECPVARRVAQRLDPSVRTLIYSDLNSTDTQAALTDDLSNYSDIRHVIYTPLFLPFTQDLNQHLSFDSQYVLSFDGENIDGLIGAPTLSYIESTAQIVQHIQITQSNEETASLIIVTEQLDSTDVWLTHLVESIELEEIQFERRAYTVVQDSDIQSIVAILDSNRFNLVLLLLSAHNASIITQTSNDAIRIITQHLTPVFDHRIIGYISVDFCNLNNAIHNIVDNNLILEQSYVSFP